MIAKITINTENQQINDYWKQRFMLKMSKLIIVKNQYCKQAN